MAGGYRIIGAEMSPYSVKVRSYFRYKAIPHTWILRNAASQAEYEKYAKSRWWSRLTELASRIPRLSSTRSRRSTPNRRFIPVTPSHDSFPR